MTTRPPWRRLRFGLATLFGPRPKGWFIPYRHAAELPRAGARPGYAAAEALFRDCEGRFRATLDVIESYGPDLAAIAVDAPAPEARWNQSWFPRLDAAALYGLVRERQPARIVEVGSGHSTRFVVRAIRDGGLKCELTAIDPKPRAEFKDLPVNWIAMTLHEAGDAPFHRLRAGDMLLIDSSHILMPGSDVDQLLGHILPGLPAGSFVHFHDIFLPDDYPKVWAWRGYNEQLGVLALLQGGAYEPVFASHYVATRMAAEIRVGAIGRLPLPAEAIESSLWLVKL